MATTAIRVDEWTHAKINDLAAEEGVSMSAIVRQAVEYYWRERFLTGLNVDLAALRADPEAWAQELEERRAWDVTLADGLDD